MARKKAELPPEQPPETTSRSEEPPRAPVPVGDANGTLPNETAPVAAPRPPDQTYKVFSDRGTVLEVAIWETDLSYDDRRSVQHDIALSRSCKNADGKWVAGTSYRAHDLPLLRVLLDLAYAWCAKRRAEVSNHPF